MNTLTASSSPVKEMDVVLGAPNSDLTNLSCAFSLALSKQNLIDFNAPK